MNTGSQSSTHRPGEHDRIVYSRCPAVPTTSNLAYQLGCFEALDTQGSELKLIAGSVDPDPKLVSGQGLWLRHAGHVKAVWARAREADTRVVALSWLEGSYPIYVRDRSGIRNASDLEGRRIGVVRTLDAPIDLLRAQNLRTFHAALSGAGLQFTDVESVDIDVEKPVFSENDPARPRDVFQPMARALTGQLVSGAIDAIAVKLPQAIIEFFGLRRIYDSRDARDPMARANQGVLRALVMSGTLLRERRDLAMRILAGLLDAGDWAVEHPRDVARLLSKDLGVPVASLHSHYEDLGGGVRPTLNPLLIEALQQQVDFLHRHALIDRRFGVDDWIDSELIAEAQRWRSMRCGPPRTVRTQPVVSRH